MPSVTFPQHIYRAPWKLHQDGVPRRTDFIGGISAFPAIARPQAPRNRVETGTMGSDVKTNVGGYPGPANDEESLTRHVDWTPEEEARAKRK